MNKKRKNKNQIDMSTTGNTSVDTRKRNLKSVESETTQRSKKELDKNNDLPLNENEEDSQEEEEIGTDPEYDNDLYNDEFTDVANSKISHEKSRPPLDIISMQYLGGMVFLDCWYLGFKHKGLEMGEVDPKYLKDALDDYYSYHNSDFNTKELAYFRLT